MMVSRSNTFIKPSSTRTRKVSIDSQQRSHEKNDEIEKELKMTGKILITLSVFVLFALTANNISNFSALAASRQAAKVITIRGKLQKTVERGGWLVVVEKEKYLILNAQKFKNEKWFAEGNEVEVTGEIKSGVMTTYMEGTSFEAHSMRPFRTRRVKYNGPAGERTLPACRLS